VVDKGADAGRFRDVPGKFEDRKARGGVLNPLLTVKPFRHYAF
jgi:hypothetical protein